jgi:hypothetical protein
MSQKRRTNKSSTTAAVQGFEGVMSDVPLSDGIELRTDLERTIWHQFSRAREDWRGMDLILLAKIVRMEADIRTAQTELDDVGMMVENKRGTPIPNPLLLVIDSLERRQLAVIRSMSLNQTASDPRTLNGFAKLDTKARSAITKVGADDLIARPQ